MLYLVMEIILHLIVLYVAIKTLKLLLSVIKVEIINNNKGEKEEVKMYGTEKRGKGSLVVMGLILFFTYRLIFVFSLIICGLIVFGRDTKDLKGFKYDIEVEHEYYATNMFLAITFYMGTLIMCLFIGYYLAGDVDKFLAGLYEYFMKGTLHSKLSG